jgi:hypothetical protein
MNTRTGNYAATSESYKEPAAYALILDNIWINRKILKAARC